MPLETGTTINDFVITNPVGGTDDFAQGDDHIRLIKAFIKQTWPNYTGAISLTSDEVNQLASLLSTIADNRVAIRTPTGFATVAPGTAGQVLTSAGTSPPVFSDITTQGNFVSSADGEPVVSSVVLDVDSVVPQSTWTVITPSNWSALNSVSVDSDWIEVRITSSFTHFNDPISASRVAQLYARRSGSNTIQTTSSQLVEAISFSNGSSTIHSNTVYCKIPVNNSQFILIWNSAYSNNSIRMLLTGFGKN